MVILNLLGKIEPTCISQKLKLYIANLPKGDFNNWNGGLVEKMEDTLKYSSVQTERFQKKFSNVKSLNIKRIFQSCYPNISVENMTELECIQHIADEMIYIYFDYNYDDMPVGDWTSNCFDSRCCERDYTEKIVDFIRFLCNEENHKKYPKIPDIKLHCIYSGDDYGLPENCRLIFSGTTNIEKTINDLVEFGALLDSFFNSEEDYYFFDYLCTELYEIDRKNFTPNHCQKLYSLCEFFLEKDTDHELDEKLPPFIKEYYSLEDRKKIAIIARQIRNKVAHGDFSKFRDKIEEYASEIMEKNNYWFDYSEYSRQNWAIMNLCFTLLVAIQNMTAIILIDKPIIMAIKHRK